MVLRTNCFSLNPRKKCWEQYSHYVLNYKVWNWIFLAFGAINLYSSAKPEIRAFKMIRPKIIHQLHWFVSQLNVLKDLQ